MIRNIVKIKGRDTYRTRVCRHRWSQNSPVKIEKITGAFSQHCGFHILQQLMKATVLAESSCYFFNFHQTLSAPAMSTDVSQVGVALFPSF